MRQIVLDTETTGLEPEQGHRIIEIGCVELRNRRITGNTWQQYLNPDREIDAGATEVHGISAADLADKPRFADIAEEFLAFVKGAELIIHNAAFDIGFLNHEFSLLGQAAGEMERHCRVRDTLALARQKHPRQKNSLDALCKRYNIDNSQRELHGALLDAQLLAEVYLAMTGGQATLLPGGAGDAAGGGETAVRRVAREGLTLVITAPNAEEQAAHATRLATLREATGGQCVWDTLKSET